jgi:homoserine dehydrogenase
LRDLGIHWQITGVASRSLGWIADPAGLNVDHLLPPSSSIKSVQNWLAAAQGNVLFEATSLDPASGQPAIEHIRAAFEHGAHAITANKGPIVHAYDELQALADARGKRFLFESTVMDGAPIFAMFREQLPTVELRGFHGILNSTTNVILSGMEEGLTFDQSLRNAQDLGIAETDASHDIDGWDAAVKVAALVRVLMSARLALTDIARKGIRDLSAEAVRAARSAGQPYKLVCRARRTGNGVEASVRPEQVPLTDAMAGVAGSSSIVYFETDIFPGLAIVETNPTVETTAYGMLADFVRALRE